MPEDVLRQIEAAFQRPHCLWVEPDMGDGVEAFCLPPDGVGESPAAPLVELLHLAATIIDELSDAIKGDRETLIAGFGTYHYYELVISH